MIENNTLTLGILGGGQLGRMSAMAAARLGIRVVIFTPEDDSPACHVAMKTILAPYDDKDALKEFAGLCDFISYEFENIPVETVQYLKTLKPVYPDDSLLAASQDRIQEKTFLNETGIPTARWASIRSVSDIEKATSKLKINDFILKTTRFGYDGKGQVLVRNGDNIQNALDQLNSDQLILEELVDFECEISVIAARDAAGKTVTYGPMLNEHENHILSRTIVPAPLPEKLQNDAIDLTVKLAESLNLRGVLTLEMFVTKDGRLLANEIAPRTHNSGHWSIDACAVSQFENHVRAVCGLPVADPARHSDAEMLNLIGDDILKLDEYLSQNRACVHSYAKASIHPGRKMGHVTILNQPHLP